MKPTIKHFVSIFLPYGIIFIAIFTILPYPSNWHSFFTPFQKSTPWWSILFLILLMFFISKKYFLDKEFNKNLNVLSLYLIWVSFCIIRGAFVAEMYWDWKGLIYNSLGLLLPVVAYSATNKVLAQSILSVFIKYGLFLFLFLIIFIRTDAYGFYLMPISFLLIFIPALSYKQKALLLLFTAIVVGADLGARSNVIKFGFPLIILIIYYLRDKISIKILELVRIVFMVVPFVFLILGATGTFNIFNISDYLGDFESTGTDMKGDREIVDLSQDTRTFLYVEVLHSAIYNDYWIFGRTPARGNDSDTFGPLAYEVTGRDERLSNEMGLANVFTWTGVIGVLLYMLVFFKASYLAINNSKNIYAKMLGIFVAFRWMYSWVEDINAITLNYFMLWIMIGLCFSYSFRSMTDYEVTIWIRGVFDKRYLDFDKYIKIDENEK